MPITIFSPLSASRAHNPHGCYPLHWRPWRFGVALAGAGPGDGR